MPDKVDKLYDDLKSQGYLEKDREHFRKFFFAPGNQGYTNRKALYDDLKGQGYLDSPTYEDFRDRLGLKAVKPTATPNRQSTPAAEPQGTQKQQHTWQQQAPWGVPGGVSARNNPAGRSVQRQQSSGDAISNHAPFRQDLTVAERAEIERNNNFATQSVERMRQQREQEDLRRNEPLVDTDNEGVDTYLTKTKGQWEDDLQGGINEMSQKWIRPNVDAAMDAATEKWFNVMESPAFAAPGSDIAKLKRANKSVDPEKMLKDLQASLEATYSNPEMQADIERQANALGLTKEEYAEQVLKPALEDDLVRTFDERQISQYMPKSATDYIIQGLGNSIGGMLMGAATETKSQRAYKNMAAMQTEEGGGDYTPGTGAKLAQMGVSFAADAPFFGFYGKVGGGVAKKLVERQIQKMVAKGMTENAARAVVASALENSVGARMKNYLMQHVVSSSITMGAYNATSEGARQLRDNEFKPGQILTSTAEGLATGAAFGVTGAASQTLTQPLSGIKKIGGKGLGFLAEAETMYTTEELAKMLHGEEGFTNPFEGSIEAIEKLGVMKVSGGHGIVKAMEGILHPVRSLGRQHVGINFTPEEEAYIRGDGQSLLEALGSMHPERSIHDVNGKKRLTEEGEAKRQELAQAYNDFMGNKEVPYTLKLKVQQIFGGLMPDAAHTPLETGADILHNADGSVIVKTRDKDGNCMQDIKFDSFSEAEEWREMHADEFALNDAVNMWNGTTADVQKAIIEEVAETYGVGDKEALEMIGRAMTLRDTTLEPEVFRNIYGVIARNAYPDDVPHVQRSYEDGRKVAPEERHRALADAEAAEQRLSYMDMSFADEVIGAWDNPDAKIQELASRDEITGEQVQAAIDYYNKRAKAEGMMDETIKSVDDRVKAANAEVDRNTNQDSGTLIQVETYGKRYYITSGQVNIGNNGLVNPQGSGKTLVVRDVETGELRMLSPDRQINVVSLEDPNTVKDMNDSMEGLRGQLMDEAEQSISYADGTPAQPIDGDFFIGADGNQYMAMAAPDGSWMKVRLDEKGEPVEEQPQSLDLDEYRQAKSNEIDTADSTEQSTTVETEAPVESAAAPQQTDQPTGKATSTAVEADGSKLPSSMDIPTDEEGRPLYEQASPEATLANLTEKYGEKRAQRMIATMAANTRSAFEAISNEDTSKITDMAELAEHEDRVAEAERKMLYWENMAKAPEVTEKPAEQEVENTENTENYAQNKGENIPEGAATKPLPTERPVGEIAEAAEQQAAEAKRLAEEQKQQAAELKISQTAAKKAVGKTYESVANDGSRYVITVKGVSKSGKTVYVDEQVYGKDGQMIRSAEDKEYAVERVGRSLVDGTLQRVATTADKLNKAYKGSRNHVQLISVLSDREQQELLAAHERVQQLRNAMAEDSKVFMKDLQARYKGRNFADVDVRQEFNDEMDQHTREWEERNNLHDAIDAENTLLSRLADEHMEELFAAGAEDRAHAIGDHHGMKRFEKARQVYGGTAVAGIFADETPNTVREFVSQNMPKNISWEDKEVNGRMQRGLASELGFREKRGIGKGKSTNAFNSYLAKTGEGISAEEAVQKMYDACDGRWDDQDIRNAMNDLFLEAEKPSDIGDAWVNDRIDDAERYIASEEQKLLDDYETAMAGEPGMRFHKQADKTNVERIRDMYDRRRKEIQKQLLDAQWKLIREEARLQAINELPQGERGLFPEIEADLSEENKARILKPLKESVDYYTRLNDTNERERLKALREAADADKRQTEMVFEDEAVERPGQTFHDRLEEGKRQTNAEPTEAQKDAGNYKKGHISFGGYDYTIENPKGSVRRGTDAEGKEWEQEMHNTYGYVRRKYGRDGDHLDMFINDDADLDNWDGKVYVIDQVNRDDSFDEHKVMYGFDSEEQARKAYLSNYEEGWQGLGAITGVDKATFDKWLDSSTRKMKPFAEHSIAVKADAQKVEQERKAFVGAVEALGGKEISIDDESLLKEFGLSHVVLSKSGDHVTLTHFISADPGKGNGTRFMEALARTADEHGWTLALTPDNLTGLTSVSKLKKFYKRFGFKDNKGRNTDFTTRESMVRRPERPDAAQREKLLMDAVVDVMRKGEVGNDVVTDPEEGQRVVDEFNGTASDLKQMAVRKNIENGIDALQRIADGEERVPNAMTRDDLSQYGGDNNITFYYGETGDPDKNFKKGYGIAHIGGKHGAETVLRVLNVIAEGKIDRYVAGNKTVVLTDGEYEAVLALTRFGNKETWLFNGWRKEEKTGATGEVSTHSDATQANPTFSREDLGAVLSDAKIQNNFDNTVKKSEKLSESKDLEQNISYHKVDNADELAQLEDGPTVKRYRAMQLIDGKLYPPMSAKVDGQMRQPTEIGVWEKAEERPDLIKNGKFVLNKGQKGQGNVPAAYNPYFHTSTSGLNDQFTSAYKRPELVVVEVEIPESELTSGYKAEGAKDAVGNVDWHSGVVNGQLPADRQRQVTLSRYSKVNRIVPDGEVADMIAKQLDGTGIEVPYNVVTPALRAELEKRGVKISATPAGSVTQDVNGNRIRQQKVGKPIFVSNALQAVEGIKQEKATPEQWLKMIEKAGGLKAAEDKWTDLSDWLKGLDKKSLTKEEVMDYIRKNQVRVEEVNYNEHIDLDNNSNMRQLREEFDDSVEKFKQEKEAVDAEMVAFNDEMYGKYGEGWSGKLSAADKERGEKLQARYNRLTDDPKELAFNEMVERYGDDFGMAFEVNWGNGKLEPQMDMYGDDISDAAKYFLQFEEQPINSTRLSYTTKGLENKKEIALTVPTVESWNESDEIHFGDAGGGRAVAWVRFGDTTDADGNRVLVIDEIQSKRHQEGRERGYRTADSPLERRHRATEAMNDYRQKMQEKYGDYFVSDDMSPEEKAEYDRLYQEMKDAMAADNDKDKSYDIPEAPFEKNWHELAMKRMLRYAAENGYDKIAWTKGDQQAERYSLSKAFDSVEREDNPSVKGRRFVFSGGNVENFVVDDNGKVIDSTINDAKGKNLSELVGKDMAVRLMALENGDMVEGEDLRIGGEGMKGFYDQILPRFMDKYGKKWGVKTGEVELPNVEKAGRKMWAVDVTPEMKESVMEGQPMFFKTSDGYAYGFTYNGKIYIDPRIATSETPVHEYTHLWAEMKRKSAPEEWDDIKRTLLNDKIVQPFIDKVRRDYPELSTSGREDDFVEEVLAQYSGRRGAERLRQAADEIAREKGGIFGKAEAIAAVESVKRALDKFWRGVAEMFGWKYTSAEEIADKVLYDLLSGKKPGETKAEEAEGIYSENFKNYFGDWENDPEHASKVVDDEGKPLVLYHGTNLSQVNKHKKFYVFYEDSHFGTIGQAQDVMRQTKRSMDLYVKNGVPMRRQRTEVYPVYLNIRNPKRVSDVPFDEDVWDGSQREWWDKQVALAKKQGYDGLVYLNEYEDVNHPADSWIAFYPEQVKSATENIGTYDPTNPDIRYEKAGAERKTAWWQHEGRPKDLNPADWKSYTTDEAKEYFANFKSEDGKTDFTKWSHPNLAYITAAAWDGANIPYQVLKDIPEIREAESIIQKAENAPKLVLSQSEMKQHARHLLDAEHGSQVYQDGKKVKDDYSGPVRQERKALVIIGKPAGGKSSVFADRLSYENGARIVDSDIVKPWLEGFDSGNGAGYVHNASAEIADMALAMAVQHGDNIIVPRIGGPSVIRELAIPLREAGYDVQLYFNDVSGKTSIIRAASRFAQEGRYLSLHYLTTINDKDWKTFSNFAEKKLGDYFNERTEEELQDIRGRVERLRGEFHGSGEGLRLLRSAEREGDGAANRALQGSLGGREQHDGGHGVSLLLDEPIFSHAEWKSNDVAFGEQPKEIWNSDSGQPMPARTYGNAQEGGSSVEEPKMQRVSRHPKVQSHVELDLFGDEIRGPVEGNLKFDEDHPAVEQQPLVVKGKEVDLKKMSDDELLQSIGSNDGRDRDFFLDEYDQRHRKEYGEAVDSYVEMLERDNVSLDDAYGMYGDVVRQWKAGGFHTSERSKLMGQIDAIEDYVERKEAERIEREEREEEERLRREEEVEAIALRQQQTEQARQYEQQKTEVRAHGYDLTKLKMRELVEGESCHVERRYTENNWFSFTGGERVESSADVAYIFRELENAGVENSFMVLVKDGVPTVIHLGIGNYASTVAPLEQAFVAAQAVDPDKVWFLHNHPSGNLHASKQDKDIYDKMVAIFGKKAQPAIIIDTKSGKYGEFTRDMAEEKDRPTSVEGDEIPVKVFNFSKQVFDKDWNPETAATAISPSDIAAFVSSHRLGEHRKMSLLVLDQAGHITGNIFLPWTTLEEASKQKNAARIATQVNQMGGVMCVIYGSYDADGSNKQMAIRYMETALRAHNVKLRDILTVGESAYERGLIGEPESEYTPMEAHDDSVADRQYEDALAKWKQRNGLPADATAPRSSDKPVHIPGEDLIEHARRLVDFRRKEALWKTAPKPEDFQSRRQEKKVVEDAIREAQRFPESQGARMNAVEQELVRLRHAVSRQRSYDRATVKAVTDFAQEFMKNGWSDNLGRGEMERILSAVKNATGKKSVKKEVDNILDILIDNHLRNLDNAVKKMASVKELKKTAQGVEAQGRLELKGQRMIQEFRNCIGSGMDADKLRERQQDLMDKMSHDPEGHDQEYEGVTLALQYVENIKGSQRDWEDLKRQRADAVKDYATSGRSYDAQQQLLESITQSMQENKMERIGLYRDFMARLGSDIEESVEGAREFVRKDQERMKNIWSMANQDLAGKAMGAFRVKDNGEAANRGEAANFFLLPMATFEQMLKQFGGRNAFGEGRLYNYYMRGWLDATNKAYLGVKAAKDELDQKAREVFGKGVKRWSDLYKVVRGLDGMSVDIVDGGEVKTVRLTQGNLLYVYMADKMSDGRMKLRNMGITEEDVAAIKDHLDPRLVQLGDWLQDEYLPRRRVEYNKVHERMFGAPMATIENYFPIKILGDARYQEEDIAAGMRQNVLPSTITGSIIKRTKNLLPLDILHTDALSLAIEHVEDMEQWAAQAEWNKDINTLLSYGTFRNKVKNMKTIYGSGDKLWEAFYNAATLAAGEYRPKVGEGSADKAVSNIAKGVTAAKISFRMYTAFKQILSAPAFLHDVDLGQFAKYSVNPYGSWKWAMENMPIFKKRWESRQVGDTRLMDDPTDWKIWKTNLVQMASRIGMSPNALVDGVTCAAGARAIYETRLKKYLSMGADEELAKKRALEDAEIGYNLTQQSSEGAFVSAMQKDRTVLANALTVFRNSPMAYTRQWVDASRNLKHRMQKGYREDSIAFMKRQLQDELGLDEAQAQKAAEQEYNRAGRHEVAKLLNFMFGVTIAWNLGASLPYLLVGDDDEAKDEMLTDAALKGFAGPIEGFAAGSIVSDLVGLATSESVRNTFREEGGWAATKEAMNKMGDYDINPLPLMADLERMIGKMKYDGYAASQEVFNICMQSAVGVNPQTFTDMWNACMDYAAPAWDGTSYTFEAKNMARAKEIALFMMRIANAPTSSWRNKYIDELQMTAEDAQKLPYDELAKRYAHYKHWKDVPVTGFFRSDDERKEKMGKIREQFDKAVLERMSRLDDEELQSNLERSQDQDERRMIAKVIHQRIMGSGQDAKKPTTDWQRQYQKWMTYEDIVADETLSARKQEAKAAGDMETVKLLEKCEDRVRKEKKKLIKGSESGEELMEKIRAIRREALDKVATSRPSAAGSSPQTVEQ